MARLSGKVAGVTGGASGIGAACAETLAREGAVVVVTDIDEPRGEALVSAIAGAGGQAIFLSHDVTDEARWREIVAEIDRRLSIVREVEAEVDANLKRAQSLQQAILAKAFSGAPT